MSNSMATLDCKDSGDRSSGSIAHQIAQAVCRYQHTTTGHSPTSVTVVLSEDTLVITLHEALTPAERAMAGSAEGATKLQEFHRQLFVTSSETLREEIKRITGRAVREAAAEVEPRSGAIVHAFTTGNTVQVFQLTNRNSKDCNPSPSA